jgi:hypothetical protein
LKFALIGIGIAVIIGIAAVGALSFNEPEPEPEEPVIKRAVPKEPEPAPIKQTQREPEPAPPKTQPSTVQSQQNSKQSCDPSYPAVCIPPYPPDLDCGEIQYSNFRVVPPDPHGFDRDKDGTGCEVGSQSSEPIQPTQETNCDPSYPDVCIPAYPPDLDCGEIGYSNFKVNQPDPHRFDGDKDGIGCES